MTTSTTAVSTWTIDPVHSVAEFSVKHLMVATVKGSFRDIDGTIHLDEAEPARSRVEASLATASIDTGVEMRDNDLRSDNFFAAERFPQITFKSTRAEKIDDDRWQVFGDLTIRGVTREVSLATEFEGRGKGFDGKEHIGFTAETSINRGDFGLTYNAVLETGGVVVGDRVKITLHIEAIRQDD
jgi:polyisoprenoid-binding protein YceI